CADIVLAARTARFTAAFPAIGFSADSGSTVTLSQRMGFSRAKRFLLLAETLTADEALATGLVDIVAADETLMQEAEALALRLAATGAARVTAACMACLDSTGELARLCGRAAGRRRVGRP